jgi:hypothetical protein
LVGYSGFLSQIKVRKKKTTRQESIQAIAITEYMSFFGYDPNYLVYLNDQPDVITALQRTLPCRTVMQIVKTTNNLLMMSIDQRSEEATHLTGVNLSIQALFNGIITDQANNSFDRYIRLMIVVYLLTR